MPAEALQRLRAKYPVYGDLSDAELARRILQKHPQYQDLLGDVAAPQGAQAPQGNWLQRQIRYLTESVPFGEQPTPELRARYPAIHVPRALRFVVEGLPRALGEGYMTGGGALGARVAGVAATEAVRRLASPVAARLAAPRVAARAVEAERFGRAALPAPGQTYRQAIPMGPPRPPATATDVGLAAQRFENIAAGMLPPGLRQPALPAPARGPLPPPLSMFRAPVPGPQAPPPAMFSRQVLRPVGPPTPPPTSPVEIPRNPQQIVFPPGGATSPQAVRQTQTRTVILNRVFGDGLGDKLADAEAVERHLLGPRNYTLRTSGFMKLSPAEDRNLFRVLEGRAQPTTPRVAGFAQRLRGMFTEDAQDYAARGARVVREATIRDPNTGQVIRKSLWDPFRPVANYAPRFTDPKGMLRANPQQFASDIARANPGMTSQDAADIVTVLRNRAMGLPRPQGVKQELVTLVERDAFLPAHLHARTRLVLPDYAYRPMREAVPQYLDQAARERAFLQTFGANADDVVEQQLTQLGGRANPHVALGEEVWDLYRGRFIEPETARRWKQSGRILNNLASGLLLGVQTAVQQPSQYASLIAQFGGRNVARGVANVVLQGGKASAERAGTFVRSLIDELALLDRLSPTATKADVAEQATAWLARTNVRLSGIRAMDEFPRAVGFHAARVWILDLQRAAALGNPRAVQELVRVKLTPTSTMEGVVMKAADLSAKYNITTGFADMPHILSTPLGTFMRGLQTFMIQQSRLSGEFLRRAARGEVAPLLRYLVAAHPIGEGVGTAVRFLQGRSTDRPGGPVWEFYGDLAAGRVPTGTVIKRAADNYAWAATLGLAQRLLETAAGTFGVPLGTGASRTLSGTEAASRLLGTGLGAGLSSGAELAIGAPAGVVRAAVDPEEAARHLKTTGRIVARRIPGIGGIVAPRLFRSEVADRRMAIEGAQRAMRRGDHGAAQRIIREYERRHGKTISEKALARGRR